MVKASSHSKSSDSGDRQGWLPSLHGWLEPLSAGVWQMETRPGLPQAVVQPGIALLRN